MTNRSLAPGVNSGTWDDPSIWASGVPAAGDYVNLSTLVSLTLTGADSAGYMFVSNPGVTLTVASGGSFTSDLWMGGSTLEVSGTISHSYVWTEGGTVIDDHGVIDNTIISGTFDFAGQVAAGVVAPVLSMRGISGFTNGIVATTDNALVQVAAPAAGSATSSAIIDNDILLGSPDAAAPARLSGVNGRLSINSSSFDIVGAAEIDGEVDCNVTTIDVGPGATLVMAAGSTLGLLPWGPAIHVASGTLDLSAAASIPVGSSIRMDDASARLVIGQKQSVAVSNFQSGDTIDVKGVAASGPLRAGSGGVLKLGTTQITLDGAAAAAALMAVSDGAGGTLLSTAVPSTVPAPTFSIAATNAVMPPNGAGVLAAFTFTISRSGDPNTAAVFNYRVTGTGSTLTSALDFYPADLTGSVTLAAGANSTVLTLYANDTSGLTQDQTFAVTLFAPAATMLTSATAAGTIQHDANAPVDPRSTIVVNGNTITSSTGAVLGYSDATLNTVGGISMDYAAAGGPAYLKNQYIYSGNDSMALATQAPNVFIHTGSGNDAIQVTSGQNVLDGGLGSNFMTGGSGTDTFFTDARGAGAVWNTMINFHQGDAATLWGFAAGVSSYSWDGAVAGAAGSQGATLRANIVGGPGRTGNGIDASITFAGLSVAQAKGLQVVTGNNPSGSYLYVYNPGV